MGALMKRWREPLLALVLIAVVVHLLVIFGAPRAIMSVAGPRIADQAGGVNEWYHSPRTTAETQQVIRSSPDIAYSACRWDVSEGPVRVTAAASDSVWSLSFYNQRTDNIASVDGGEDVAVVLGTADQLADASVPEEAETVTVEGTKGVALLRYLAPRQEDFDAADDLRQQAECAPLTP